MNKNHAEMNHKLNDLETLIKTQAEAIKKLQSAHPEATNSQPDSHSTQKMQAMEDQLQAITERMKIQERATECVTDSVDII